MMANKRDESSRQAYRELSEKLRRRNSSLVDEYITALEHDNTFSYDDMLVTLFQDKPIYYLEHFTVILQTATQSNWTAYWL
jgi:hypothetical protein